MTVIMVHWCLFMEKSWIFFMTCVFTFGQSLPKIFALGTNMLFLKCGILSYTRISVSFQKFAVFLYKKCLKIC